MADGEDGLQRLGAGLEVGRQFAVGGGREPCLFDAFKNRLFERGLGLAELDLQIGGTETARDRDEATRVEQPAPCRFEQRGWGHPLQGVEQCLPGE